MWFAMAPAMTVNDVTINDVPRICVQNPTHETHSIIVQDPDHQEEVIILPLALRGVTSYLQTVPVTREEYESGECSRIELTSEHEVWEPNNTRYQEQEEILTGNYLLTLETVILPRGD